MWTMCQLKGIDHGFEKGAGNHLPNIFLILELQPLLPRNFWVGMDALLCNMCRWMHIYIQGASCINGRSPNTSICRQSHSKRKNNRRSTPTFTWPAKPSHKFQISSLFMVNSRRGFLFNQMILLSMHLILFVLFINGSPLPEEWPAKPFQKMAGRR